MIFWPRKNDPTTRCPSTKWHFLMLRSNGIPSQGADNPAETILRILLANCLQGAPVSSKNAWHYWQYWPLQLSIPSSQPPLVLSIDSRIPHNSRAHACCTESQEATEISNKTQVVSRVMFWGRWPWFQLLNVCWTAPCTSEHCMFEACQHCWLNLSQSRNRAAATWAISRACCLEKLDMAENFLLKFSVVAHLVQHHSKASKGMTQ